MNKSIKIAKELIKLAKNLIASDINAYLLPGLSLSDVFEPEVTIEAFKKEENSFKLNITGAIFVNTTSFSDIINSIDGTIEIGIIQQVIKDHFDEIINECVLNEQCANFPHLELKKEKYNVTTTHMHKFEFEATTMTDAKTVWEISENALFSVSDFTWFDENNKPYYPDGFEEE